MSTQVVMPQMGESLSEGTITKWHKKPGESVERDEPLFEITTDKVDTEVPAPVSGIVQQILVAEGETVAIGTVVAEIGGAAANRETPSASASEAPKGAAPSTSGGGHFRSSHEPETFQRKPPRAATPPAGAPGAGERRRQLSPAVISLAARHDIPMDELLAIPGSGRGGRITKKDVERFLAEPREAAGGVATTSASEPATPSALVETEPPERYRYRPEPSDEMVPMSAVRRQIAEHMLWSQRISAPVTSFAECDVHRIVRYRDEESAHFEEREGVPLTFLPFVAEVTVRALKRFPIFNASVVGDRVALKKHVHLGIAVALDEGLIAPVIHKADEMSFVGLARAIHERTERAKARALGPEEAQGASFTITTPGMFGGLMGTPMIAQPQVAILGLGTAQKKPVVIDDAIAIRPIMVLALTFDHRVIDGTTAFQFLERVRVDLETFELRE